MPYRPHPDATYPDAVHATDLITRWITGGEVVQTFNPVDIYSNDAYSTSHATKTAAACEPLLHTWQQLGVTDMAQFDKCLTKINYIFLSNPREDLLNVVDKGFPTAVGFKIDPFIFDKTP
jgi:hypothetical protein